MGAKGLGIAAACAIATCLSPSGEAAAAEEDGVRLEWIREQGAESCPSGGWIVDDVSRRLGRDPFTSHAKTAIEVSVRREKRAWKARIRSRDATGAPLGAREITSDAADCGPLAEAVALAVALTIDPEAASRPPPAPPVAPAVTPTPKEPDLAPAIGPPTAPPGPERASVEPKPAAPIAAPDATSPSIGNRDTASVWMLLAGVTRGLLPHVSPSFSMSGRARIAAPFSLGAGVLWLPDGHTSDDAFAFGLTAGWLGPCEELAYGERGSVSLCQALMAGEMHAVVANPSQASPGQTAWFAASGSVHGVLRLLGPMSLQVTGEAIAPLGPFELRAIGCDTAVFSQAALALQAAIGVGVLFR